MVLCANCPENYLGKAWTVKQRISKHRYDVHHPENSNCKKCINHIRDSSKLVEPYFNFYPFFYVEGSALRHFMERRFIGQWKPTLNVH